MGDISMNQKFHSTEPTDPGPRETEANEEGDRMGAEPTLEDLLREALTRRQLLRRMGIGGVVVSAPTLLAACGGSSSNPASAQKAATGNVQPVDHITWLSNIGTSMDSATSADVVTSSLVTEPVVIYDANLEPAGHLAEPRAVDASTYVYKLRQGVKFHDGTPLTAEDVAFAMLRHTDPKVESGYAGLIPELRGIEVTGPGEVTVRLKAPSVVWQYLPAFMLVAPKKFFQEQGKDYGAPGKPLIGTGPYKLSSFRASDRAELVRNEAYWGEKPIAKTITMVNVADAQTSLLGMRSGDADGTFGVSASILSQWKQIPTITVTTRAAPHLAFASFDVSTKPWNDVHVRRAFAHAIDKAGLARALFKGAAQPQSSMLPPPMLQGKIPPERQKEIYASLPVYDFDLTKAKQELAQSAYPNGLKAKLWYYAGDTSEKAALTWQQNLKKIGVNLKLDVADENTGADREDNHHDLGFHLNDSWAGTDYPDPADLMTVLLPSDQARSGYFNEANYKNPEVDRLITQNVESLDENMRIGTLVQVMRIVATDLPYIPLWTRNDSVALSDKFVYEGYTPWAQYQGWIHHLKRAA
jgi:peptide/nickel transport system substrate-binding protein